MNLEPSSISLLIFVLLSHSTSSQSQRKISKYAVPQSHLQYLGFYFNICVRTLLDHSHPFHWLVTYQVGNLHEKGSIEHAKMSPVGSCLPNQGVSLRRQQEGQPQFWGSGRNNQSTNSLGVQDTRLRESAASRICEELRRCWGFLKSIKTLVMVSGRSSPLLLFFLSRLLRPLLIKMRLLTTLITLLLTVTVSAQQLSQEGNPELITVSLTGNPSSTPSYQDFPTSTNTEISFFPTPNQTTGILT
jgi:hypothetical protein